ncbi:sulfur carrier protein ThiS [Tessaracoccus sp. G1721]
MRVNGEEIPGAAGQSLLDLLTSRGFDVHRVAVELGGQIVPRARYDSVRVGHDDIVEVVAFVGGG